MLKFEVGDGRRITMDKMIAIHIKHIIFTLIWIVANYIIWITRIVEEPIEFGAICVGVLSLILPVWFICITIRDIIKN